MRSPRSLGEVEDLLEQADAFVRHGDYLEARARVEHARAALGARAGGRAYDDVARAERQCDDLVSDWEEINAARSAAYAERERMAIDRGTPPATSVTHGWARALELLRSAFNA